MDLGDVIFILDGLFGPQAMPCSDASDSNDDGMQDIADPVMMLTALFNGGDLPPDPGPITCGYDPTFDALDCESFGACP